MTKSDFGEYMRESRKIRGIGQSKMAEELGVSNATLSRIERGEKIPTLSQYERIMQTLGEYSGDYVNAFLLKHQLYQNNIVSKLRCALRDGREDDATLQLQLIKDSDMEFENEYTQFIMYANIMLVSKITNETAIEQLMQALALTKKTLPLPNIANVMLHYNDIVILDELANRRAQIGDVDFAIDLLTAIKDSIDKFYVDEREKSVAYPALLFNLSNHLLAAKGLHDEVLALCRTT